MFLLFAVGAIAWETIQRFGEPVPVAGKTVMIVVAIGILVNGITAWLFASGAKGDINIKGAFLHMAADAAVSAGVVIAGLVILYTGWTWLDPVVSLAIVAVIVWSTWGLLRDSLTLSLAAVPPGIDPDAVRSHLEGLPGVAALHDLHVWAMSTTETYLTAHLLMPGGRPDDAFLMDAAAGIRERFGIGHTTLQVETSADTACALPPPTSCEPSETCPTVRGCLQPVRPEEPCIRVARHRFGASGHRWMNGGFRPSSTVEADPDGIIP
ncbi:Zinc transporter ZitB [Methylobacterium thuringiense]|uniref:Zinc transporter ZitB n=1 Tax=Methylobacterium thuringiense TaxID=1003091 RepID=A0ABQ4TKW0_9HYPH|nr:Zinc transporter ZitB [Methylobacterium thuringiense]